MIMTQKELDDACIACSPSEANSVIFTAIMFAVIFLIGIGAKIVHTIQAPEPAAMVASK